MWRMYRLAFSLWAHRVLTFSETLSNPKTLIERTGSMAVRSSVRNSNSGNKRSNCTAGSGTGAARPPTRQRRAESAEPSEVDDGRQRETAARETVPGVPAVVVGQQRENRQREEEQREDATGTSGGGSSGSVVSVITDFTGGGSFTTNEKVALKQVVKTDVFPKMKYVHDLDDLAYGSDAYKAIKENLDGDLLAGMGEDELKKWWAPSKRNFVRAQINLRRNNVCRIVKEKFFGKQAREQPNRWIGLTKSISGAATEMMDENRGDVPYSLEEMTSGLRTPVAGGELNEETIKTSTFAYVMDKFMPAVVGKNVWNGFQWQQEIRKFANKTDEILLWFLLENYYKTWEAAYKAKMTGGAVDVVKPKFTSNGGGKEGGKYRGWSPLATKRWNEISDTVVKMRENQNQKYDALYLEWKKKVEEQDREKRNRKRVRTQVTEEEEDVVMVHGFGD